MVHVAGVDQVAQIRQEVVKQLGCASAAIADDDIQRYFRASGGSMATCINRLVASGRWRQETDPSCLPCPTCLNDSHSHYLHL